MIGRGQIRGHSYKLLGDIVDGIFGGGSEAPDYRPTAEASRYAADLQYKATVEGRDLLKEFFEKNQELVKPWVEMAEWSLGKLRDGMEQGLFEQPQWMGEKEFARTFKTSPGYQFRQRESQKRMRRAFNAGQYGGSGAGGGAHMKAAAEYAGNLASQEYSGAYQRALTDYTTDLENKRYGYNRLASLAQVGQVGPTTAVGINNQYTQGVNNLAMQGANALGAGQINAANAMVQQQYAENAASVSNFNRNMRVMSFLGF